MSLGSMSAVAAPANPQLAGEAVTGWLLRHWSLSEVMSAVAGKDSPAPGRNVRRALRNIGTCGKPPAPPRRTAPNPTLMNQPTTRETNPKLQRAYQRPPTPADPQRRPEPASAKYQRRRRSTESIRSSSDKARRRMPIIRSHHRLGITRLVKQPLNSSPIDRRHNRQPRPLMPARRRAENVPHLVRLKRRSTTSAIPFFSVICSLHSLGARFQFLLRHMALF